MAVRIKQYSTNGIEQTEYTDVAIENRTAYDPEGYGYHFAPNQVRNFLDEGRGVAVQAFGATKVVNDAIPFGQAFS